MIVEREKVEYYLHKWQEILRLRDWDIKTRIIETEWRKSGDIKIDLDDKKAVLLINQHPKSENLEEIIIHELLHIKLYGMDQMIEQFIISIFGNDERDPKSQFAYTQFFMLLERTVEDLTKAYLSTGGEEKELSFGRLAPEVEKEINN